MRIARFWSSSSFPLLKLLSNPTTLTLTPTFSLLPKKPPSHSLSSRTPILAGDISGVSAIVSGNILSSIARVRVSAMSTTTTGMGEDSRGLVEFALSPSSSLKIMKGDITQWSVDGSSDAIVNAANERMLGGGGVDGAIHRAAGPELKEACYKVPEVSPGVRCPTGEARITPGFKLPASHVIHTVGPIYDVDKNPEASLKNAYRNSLRVAKENNIQYVAFPAISCGVYGYPFDEAASIAISTIKQFANDFKEVHFVLFSDDIYQVWAEKAKEIVEK